MKFVTLLLDFLIFIGYSLPPYVIFVSILQLCCLFIDSYLCPTEVIATFHSLSISSATIGKYSNIVLIIFCHMFFFSKNIVCSSSVSAFIAKTSNLIMKSAMFHFPYLKNSIFHLASAAFILLLNVILISLTNSYQSWVPSSLSSLLSFLLLQTQVLRVRQANKPCIRLTQENSIENSVQDYLPYILLSMVCAMTTLVLPKCPCFVLIAITYLSCFFLKANMPCLCALTLFSLISVIYVCTMCTL